MQNKLLICKEGDPKSADINKMKSVCFYDGSCNNIGLNSIYIGFLDGKRLEIVKNQYLF
jgi:hypothetical protein